MSTRRKRTPKKSQRLYSLNCCWENCDAVVMIQVNEYGLFSDHLQVHANDFVQRLRHEAGIEVELGNEDCTISCCCMWRSCSWEGCEDTIELVRHVMLHGYHEYLKAIGLFEQEAKQLNPCQIEYEDPFQAISMVSIPFICQWQGCNAEFYCPNKFYRHVEEHAKDGEHSRKDKKQKGEKVKADCLWKDCHGTFGDVYKVAEHLRVHTHEKLMACPGCGSMFANKTKFFDHLVRQNVEAYENFQCSHCLKRCASERLLRDHMRHHVNYLKCPHCEMTCPNSGSLQLHIGYRHLDVRPFQCALCEYSCKSKADLVRHEESHLPKSYICDVDGCDFETKTAHCLRRHIRKRHDSDIVQRYVCHICNNRYSRGFGLTKHLKRQHHFSWPSGHPRFRYIEYDDGLFRLQMVRFESAELTKRAKESATSEAVDNEENTQQGDSNVENQGDSNTDKENKVIAGEPVTEQVLEARNANILQLKSSDLSTPSTFSPTSIAVNNAHNSASSLSSKKNFYLQPKPEGYTTSLQEQLLSFSDNPSFSTIEYDGLELANAIRALLPTNELIEESKETLCQEDVATEPVEVARIVELNSNNSFMTVVDNSNLSGSDTDNITSKCGEDDVGQEEEDTFHGSDGCSRSIQTRQHDKDNKENGRHTNDASSYQNQDSRPITITPDSLMDFGTLVEKIIENTCTSSSNQAEGPAMVALNIDSIDSIVPKKMMKMVNYCPDEDDNQQIGSESDEAASNEVDQEDEDRPGVSVKRQRLDYDSVFTNPNPVIPECHAEISTQLESETGSSSKLAPSRSPRPKIYSKRITPHRPARHTPNSRRRIASALIERLGLQNIPYKFRFHTVDDMAQEVVIDTSNESEGNVRTNLSKKDVIAELEFEVNDSRIKASPLNASDLDQRMDASHVLLSLQKMKGATDE